MSVVHVASPSNLMFHPLQSCAIQEIHGLMLFKGRAEQAMKEFCKQVFGKPLKFFTETINSGAMYSFYVFSEPVPKGGGKSYASDFAKFIKDNKLGELWQSPSKGNETFHPGHDNQMFVWMPNKEALRRWHNGSK